MSALPGSSQPIPFAQVLTLMAQAVRPEHPDMANILSLVAELNATHDPTHHCRTSDPDRNMTTF